MSQARESNPNNSTFPRSEEVAQESQEERQLKVLFPRCGTNGKVSLGKKKTDKKKNKKHKVKSVVAVANILDLNDSQNDDSNNNSNKRTYLPDGSIVQPPANEKDGGITATSGLGFAPHNFNYNSVLSPTTAVSALPTTTIKSSASFPSSIVEKCSNNVLEPGDEQTESNEVSLMDPNPHEQGQHLKDSRITIAGKCVFILDRPTEKAMSNN